MNSDCKGEPAGDFQYSEHSNHSINSDERLGVVPEGPPDDLKTAVEFDWDGVEPDVEARARELAWEMLRAFVKGLFDWIHSSGAGKPRGVLIRTYVASWTICEHLRDLSQVQLAQLIGAKDKQSIGREVSAFRDRFGWIRAGLHSEAARESCRRREKIKRSRTPQLPLLAHEAAPA